MTLDRVTIRLNVQDLQVSSAYYRKLGFERHDGNDENWLILTQGSITIGLFEGILDNPISLSFTGASPKGLLDLAVASRDAANGVALTDPDGTPLHFEASET
jgi:predicted lactoylglutathione lyase